MCVCAGYSVTQARRLLSWEDETIVTGKDVVEQADGCIDEQMIDGYIDRQALPRTVKKMLVGLCCWW